MKEIPIIDNTKIHTNQSDVLILGAGAAGLFCAITAAQRGRSVVVLEHNRSVGEKIRISGGGRCNFTNLQVSRSNFISSNPHFCTSALARYSQDDFIRLVEKHGIAYYEKKDGQLFCEDGAGKIIDMLLKDCRETGVRIETMSEIADVKRGEDYRVSTLLESRGEQGTGSRVGKRDDNASTVYSASRLVVATGGLSIPKLGASSLGYEIAKRFGIPVIEPRPGLVPLLVAHDPRLEEWGTLAGISFRVTGRCGGASWTDDLLFTHRGLSGPVILQLSSYWDEGEPLVLDLLPEVSFEDLIAAHEGKTLKRTMESVWPRRFAEAWLPHDLADLTASSLSKKGVRKLGEEIHSWIIRPEGTDGFNKAEVTVGGVDTHALSSKTMEARDVPGLYFIGEVVDVTGWLGGYNFQWAWSSGFAAGSSV